MKIDYNIWFEVAGAVSLAILLIYVPLSYDMRVRRNRGFFWLALAGLVADLLDVLTAITLSNPVTVGHIFNLILNEVYYFSLGLLGFAFVHYSYMITGEGKSRADRLVYRASLLFLIAFCILLIVNIPTGLIASFTDTEYVHGPAYGLIFFYPFFMIGLAFVRMLFLADELKDRKKKLLMLSDFLLCVGASILQLLVFPRVLLSLFGFSVGMVFMIMLMETPDYQSLLLSVDRYKDAEARQKETAGRLARSVEERNAFLEHLAHELRTPLNAVIGYADLIKKDPTDQTGTRAEKIRKEGLDILAMTENVTELLELDNDNEDEAFREEVYPLSLLVTEIREKLLAQRGDKDLPVRFQIDPDLAPSFRGDRYRILQVISALTSNAVKYTSSGQILVSLHDNGRGFIFSIEDSGRGIDPADLGKIKEPFFRGGEVREGDISGMGLGLTLAERILNLMGSDLKYESTYGSGSRFWFSLDQGRAGEGAIGKDEAKALSIVQDGGEGGIFRGKALAVDDNDMNLDILKLMLEKHGLVVDMAKNGKEALEKIRGGTPYRVIFMDHFMPVMDGVEAMRVIREEGLCPHTPVIALTANAPTDAQRKYKNLGFTACLLKPITEDVLLRALTTYIREDAGGPVRTIGEEESKQAEGKPASGAPAGGAMSGTGTASRLAEFLDTGKALTYCMGNEEFYEHILSQYVEGDKRDLLGKALADGNLDTYRINVHALKSTSLTIGAPHLSEGAKALEKAAADGDKAYITSHHDGVMKEYGDLLKKIQDALSGEEEEETAPARTRIRIEDGDRLEGAILAAVLGRTYEIVTEGKADIYLTDREEMVRTLSPVIFITEMGGEVKAASMGASDVITRPVVIGLLKKRLSGIIGEEERRA